MKRTSTKDSGPYDSVRAWVQDHRRTWKNFRYVYPVISRRSGGLSIGVNLSPNKLCNFNCVYCQVNRGEKPERQTFIDLGIMQTELDQLLDSVLAPEFWKTGPFAEVGESFRRLDNIAFSGDGEPTMCRWLEQAVAIVAATKVKRNLKDLRIVLITNATQLQERSVQQAMRLLDYHQGEVWAKLDAGTEEQYQLINRSYIPFARVLENVLNAGRSRSLVIQSMFMRERNRPVSEADFDAYLARLESLRLQGCRIARVQLYTIARQTAEAWATPLKDAELDSLAERFRKRLPDLPAEVIYGA